MEVKVHLRIKLAILISVSAQSAPASYPELPKNHIHTPPIEKNFIF
jgi:hypothetical protein